MIEELKDLLVKAQALMYEDYPPGKNEIEAYQLITKACSLLENVEVGEAMPRDCPLCQTPLRCVECGWAPINKPPAEDVEHLAEPWLRGCTIWDACHRYPKGECTSDCKELDDPAEDVGCPLSDAMGGTEEPWTGYPNRWGPEFKDSPCGSCGHNTTGDMMDSDKCADLKCEGDFSKWIPTPAEEPAQPILMSRYEITEKGRQAAEEPEKEGRWTCDHCGATRIGEEKSCRFCGDMMWVGRPAEDRFKKEG